ncbi:MAG: hypothetical protein KKI08_11595 [Armatimonadetes bacterium]|nr:hypothetical protein [Armatimonadota bacterium]
MKRTASWWGGVGPSRKRRGQALLVAVLLMSVILLVGILFAALVSFNQGQSSRHVDVVAAGQNAEAGVNYANSQLQYSPQGADWRPHFVAYAGTGTEDQLDPSTWPQDPAQWPSPPAQYADGSVDFNFWGLDGTEGTEDDYYSDFDMVRGWFPLRAGSVTSPERFLRMGFHRYPDPNQLGSSRDSLQMGRGYFLLQVTYDPDPPYEPDDAPTPRRMSNCLQIVSIGRAVQDSNVFRRLVAYKPLGLTDYMKWVTNQSGGARQATVAVRPNVDMDASGSHETGEVLYSYSFGPVRSEPPLYWLGQEITTGTPSTLFRLYTAPLGDEGYLRDDAFLAPRGLYALDGSDAASGGAVSVDGAANATLPVALDPGATNAPNRVYVDTPDVPELAPVDLNATDPVSGKSRYHALTRDSGPVVRATAADAEHDIAIGDPVNIGLYGHGGGMYIDNVNDIQYRGNLAALMNDWLRSPTGQGYAGSDTGWNPLFTTYSPPGVEIEFFPNEAAVAATATGDIGPGDDPTALGVNQLWWPRHVAGTPGIKITRHDKRWRRADRDTAWHVGGDSGRNVMVIDYPEYPHQVIFAEGNVRVKGVLPARDRTTPGGPLDGSFDMTVVSNGTIYIDGQLMTYQDVKGRKHGTNDPTAPSDAILDEDTAKVALLARDYVCLNPTQIVPQMTSGLVTAAADDEANPTLADQHWELFPNTGGAVYAHWRFGWPNVDTDQDGFGNGAPGVPTGNSVSFVPIQAGADPGPSGMAMTVYNEQTPATVPYVFGNDVFGNPGAVNPIDQWCFALVPPGALIGSVPTPSPYASNAIAPQWQTLGSTPAQPFSSPAVPFCITPDITTDIGYANAVSVYQRDPQLGTGSTAYLIKKWKIEEFSALQNPDDSRWYQIPRPAVHCHVNALMLAQRGSWFVIPGAYFDPDATTVHAGGTANPAWESLYAARFRRYNYEIVVRGAITEDHTAPLEAQQTWMTRWAFPIYSGSGGSLSLIWGSVRYEFDERLRQARDQSPATLTGVVRRSASDPDNVQGLLPKLPCLPASSTLMYE